MCESARLNQSMSHRQSIIPVHTIPQGVRSPQVVLFAPLPSQSDIHLVSHCPILSFFTYHYTVLYLLYYNCKTSHFCCTLILQFWNVEILLHFNLAFSQCCTSTYQANDGQSEFSWYPIQVNL